jgi:hypothetical protein
MPVATLAWSMTRCAIRSTKLYALAPDDRTAQPSVQIGDLGETAQAASGADTFTRRHCAPSVTWSLQSSEAASSEKIDEVHARTMDVIHETRAVLTELLILDIDRCELSVVVGR